jgi:hypothetical protein
MQKGYCRWLTLAIDGCEQGIFGTRELRKEAKFILCSDGYYNPLVTSVHEFGDLIADSEFYGIMHMMERRKMMEGRSPLIQSKYYDDATAILIIPRVNY